jgi:hypothetical protein
MLAEVLPINATNPSVTWSVISGTGNATINTAGLLTATADGTVTVRATANDGSAVFGEIVITVSGQVQQVGPPTITSPSTLTIQHGTSATHTLTATGTTPITFTLANEPTGVSISGNQLIVSSAIAVATHNFQIIATNIYGSNTQNFTLTVSAQQPPQQPQQPPSHQPPIFIPPQEDLSDRIPPDRPTQPRRRIDIRTNVYAGCGRCRDCEDNDERCTITIPSGVATYQTTLDISTIIGDRLAETVDNGTNTVSIYMYERRLFANITTISLPTRSISQFSEAGITLRFYLPNGLIVEFDADTLENILEESRHANPTRMFINIGSLGRYDNNYNKFGVSVFSDPQLRIENRIYYFEVIVAARTPRGDTPGVWRLSEDGTRTALTSTLR